MGYGKRILSLGKAPHDIDKLNAITVVVTKDVKEMHQKFNKGVRNINQLMMKLKETLKE
jgi:hypothetical protein